MAHSTGLRFFLFEADGTLRRLSMRTVDGMVRGEDRIMQYAGKRLRAAAVSYWIIPQAIRAPPPGSGRSVPSASTSEVGPAPAPSTVLGRPSTSRRRTIEHGHPRRPHRYDGDDGPI